MVQPNPQLDKRLRSQRIINLHHRRFCRRWWRYFSVFCKPLQEQNTLAASKTQRPGRREGYGTIRSANRKSMKRDMVCRTLVEWSWDTPFWEKTANHVREHCTAKWRSNQSSSENYQSPATDDFCRWRGTFLFFTNCCKSITLWPLTKQRSGHFFAFWRKKEAI